MERIDDNTIAFTQDEADCMRDFIRQQLRREWDDYTNTFITKTSDEDGMARMDPEMYKLANMIGSI